MPSDFTYTPDYVFVETPTFNTLISKFESGVEQRRAKRSAVQRKWTLQFTNKGKTEADAVNTFFQGKKGALTAFTWTNPIDSVEYTVRFVDDSFEMNLIAYQLYSYQFSFIEVL